MNLILTREEHEKDGVFSRLTDDKNNFVALTLERLFDGKPKIPANTYKCVRGMHRLPSMEEDFETFEVMDVPGCTGILFHVGNYPADSEGCILVGSQIGYQSNRQRMLVSSKKAFLHFMSLQEGVDEFELKVMEDV